MRHNEEEERRQLVRCALVFEVIMIPVGLLPFAAGWLPFAWTLGVMIAMALVAAVDIVAPWLSGGDE